MPRFIVDLEAHPTYRKIVRVPCSTHTRDEATSKALEETPSQIIPALWEIANPGQTRHHSTELAPEEPGREPYWNVRVTCEIHLKASQPIYTKSAALAESFFVQASSTTPSLQVPHALFKDWHSHDTPDSRVKVLAVRREDAPIRPKSKFVADLRETLAPDRPIWEARMDETFELLRWMVATSQNYKDGHFSVHRLLCGEQTRGLGEAVAPVISSRDLQNRIQFAVLGTSHQIYEDWRLDHGITPTSKIEINALNHSLNNRNLVGVFPRYSISEALIRLWEYAPGTTLTAQLNSVHADAKFIQSIGVMVYPQGFALALRYGPKDGWSGWDYILARTHGDEPFYETISRGIRHFQKLVPDFEKQVSSRSTPPRSETRHHLFAA